MLTRAEAADFLRSHDRYVLLTHKRPDGDTLGSAAALCHGLRSIGKTCHILANPEITPRYQWLHEGLTVDAPQPEATLVSVDIASPSLLPVNALPLLGRIQLRIDHHSNATSFAPNEVVDGDSASCAELVWDILELLEVPRLEKTLKAVYVGLSTDTGCFRFANVTAHSFAVAAQCAQAGVAIADLNQVLFETHTLRRLQMEAWIVAHMQLLAQGQGALVAIPKAVELELEVDEDDMDSISSFPRSIEGVRLATTLRELPDGEIKLSVRAAQPLDAGLFAAQFGGGGHSGSAGATYPGVLAEVAQEVAAAMVATLGK